MLPNEHVFVAKIVLCCQESLCRQESLFYVAKIVCFMLPRVFVLCCQKCLFYVATRVCFMLPRELLFFKIVCFMLPREFVLCCQDSLFYVAKRVCFKWLSDFVLLTREFGFMLPR
jgi:hypothetical protein